MIWETKEEQWFGVEHCKTPELLRDALLEGYRDAKQGIPVSGLLLH